MYEEIYDDLRKEFIRTLFDESLRLIEEKKYDKAEALLDQMGQLDTAYKNVSVLRMSTVLEPQYNDGVREMNAGNYKDALRIFEKIAKHDAGYKDVQRLKEESISHATVTLGITPVQGHLKDS